MALHHMLRAAAGNTAGPSDPYFEYNTLLLTGDGTNGAQNNTFVDSSSNNFTITRNGNTTQGSFSPYGNLWSNYFDGSGDYLSTPSSSNFTFGTGDFTIETWVYWNRFDNAIGSEPGVFQTSTTSGGLAITYTSGVQLVRTGGVYAVACASSTFLNTSRAPLLNVWEHIAIVRSGSTLTVYVNGINVGSQTNTNNVAATYCAIGGYYNTSYLMDGYVSNFRVVKGTAVYTSNFTSPTAPLTAVSGTSLLTCQSNRFKDNSSNNFALTVNGNTSVQRFSPFNPTAPYSTSTIGGSGYFDGSGDSLTVADNAAFGFGTGDFTIEFWLNYQGGAGYVCFTVIGTTAPYIYYGLNNGTYNPFIWSDGNVLTTSTAITLNTWQHHAVVRSGSTVTIYLNGVSIGSTTWTANFGTSDSLSLGAVSNGTQPTVGYISDYRVIKGSAVYTSNFTPPAAPLTAITNTSLLCNFTNAGIPDAAMMNDLETVGNAQVSTSVKKYGTGSLYFDGTGDGLFARPTTPVLALGGGDFTIEVWIYPTSLATYDTIYDSRIGDSGTGIAVLLNSSGNVVLYYSAAVQFTSSSTVSTNVWTHVAVVRSGTTITVYINGTSAGTKTSVSTNFSDGNAVIGQVNDVATHFYNGYIDDFRITKGYARYTANFTPPTAALPTY